MKIIIPPFVVCQAYKELIVFNLIDDKTGMQREKIIEILTELYETAKKENTK